MRKFKYLKGIKFRSIRDFWPFSPNFYPWKVSKPQNREIKYPRNLNTCRLWDSLFPNIWSKYDVDTHISHISTYSNISVTYLIINTLTIEKLIFNEIFISYFYWNCEIKYPWNVLQSSNPEIKYLQNVTFFQSRN